MLFRALSDDFQSLAFPGKLARLRVDLAEQLESIIQQLALHGVISGDDLLKVSGDFGQKDHVCCVVQGSSPISAIEIDSVGKVYILLNANASAFFSARQSGDPVLQGPRQTLPSDPPIGVLNAILSDLIQDAQVTPCG